VKRYGNDAGRDIEATSSLVVPRDMPCRFTRWPTKLLQQARTLTHDNAHCGWRRGTRMDMVYEGDAASRPVAAAPALREWQNSPLGRLPTSEASNHEMELGGFEPPTS